MTQVAENESSSVQQADVRIRRVVRSCTDLSSILWSIYQVEAIVDRNGHTLGFYGKPKSIGERGYRDSLPVEIFNHQLKDIDPANPTSLECFMSEYGLLYDSWPSALGEMASYNKFVNIRKWGAPSHESLDAEITQIRDCLSASLSFSEGRQATRKLWIGELEDLHQHISRGWDGYEPKLSLVSYEEVLENLELISQFISLAVAVAKNDKPNEIAMAVGIPAEELSDEILYRDQMLNALLSVFTPKVGVQYLFDGVVGEPSYYCDKYYLLDEEGPNSPALMNAIALQIRDFNLNLSNARECSECGSIFIEKQSKRSTRKGHSDSKYCCDKCKNRHAQKRHRETEGYKRKRKAISKSLALS